VSTAGYTLPGSQIHLLSLNADALRFVPVWRGLTLMFNGNVAYSQALGDTTSVPQFRRFLPETGFGARLSREQTGSEDFYGRPYGGNLLTVLQLNCCSPCRKNSGIARVSVCFMTW